MTTAWGTVKDVARATGEGQIIKSLIICIKELGFICTERVDRTPYTSCMLKTILWDNKEDVLKKAQWVAGQYTQSISIWRETKCYVYHREEVTS